MTYPDNTYETYYYNALGQLTNRTDALGSRKFAYNNQGLLVGVANAYGTERYITFDIYDQPTTVLDGNAVSVTQTFDRLGRLLTRAVPGQGTETNLYTARGLTNYTGPDGKLTRYFSDAALRKISETTPKNEVITNTFNAAGDLLTLADGRNKTTTWTYDAEGLVRGKKYHGQSFTNVEYHYDLNQRLDWRTFRSSSTSSNQTLYSYNDVGSLTNINYPNSPDVSFAYNEVNQMASMTTAGLGTNFFTYTDAGNLLAEYGLWATDGITNAYHASVPGLKTGLSIQQPPNYYWSQTYGFDAARRLTNVTSPAGTFGYAYKGPGSLWTNLALPYSMAITNVFDTGARLTGTYLKTSAGIITNQHVYLYNSAGQRQRHTKTDNTYTTFGYDDDAQLTSALGYNSGGSPITTEQLTFGYDPGWNMTNRSVNGSPMVYSVNDLNQALGDGSGSTYAYDANGNLVTNYLGGVPGYVYTYDEENRLALVAYVYASAPSTAWWRTDFIQDGLGRLRVRQEYTWVSGAWSLGSTVRYLYDGMRVVQERDGSNTPVVGYTRGQDLSGSFEGAGGIGGLLARSHGYSGGSWGAHNLYHADGGGNITYMVNSSQTMAASYKYDAYGRTISSSGTLAGTNVYRFSSKQWHHNSGLYYYGYRFYNPSLQRWMNRDPIAEEGGLNLYTYVSNHPTEGIDPFGLAEVGRDSAGITVVTVERCEIVLMISHGNPRNNPSFIFPPRGGCPSGGGFIGCYADQINASIQKREAVLTGRPKAKPNDSLWAGKVMPFYNKPDWDDAVEESLKGVPILVNEWLKDKTKCCPSVKVTAIGTDDEPVAQTFSSPITSFKWPKKAKQKQ